MEREPHIVLCMAVGSNERTTTAWLKLAMSCSLKQMQMTLAGDACVIGHEGAGSDMQKVGYASQVLEGDVKALADRQPLPFKSAAGGATSALSRAPDDLALRGQQTAPRDHA